MKGIEFPLRLALTEETLQRKIGETVGPGFAVPGHDHVLDILGALGIVEENIDIVSHFPVQAVLADFQHFPIDGNRYVQAGGIFDRHAAVVRIFYVGIFLIRVLLLLGVILFGNIIQGVLVTACYHQGYGSQKSKKPFYHHTLRRLNNKDTLP